MTVHIGWWLLPILLTVGSLAWAIPMRASERPTGGMFSEMGYIIGGGFRTLCALILSLVAWLIWALASAFAQDHRHHPAADMPLHEKFYQNWMMPNDPSRSCCNKADCYPTEIQMRHGEVYARRREDGKWLHIPASKIERHRDNPDGRNHLCAPPPSAGPDTVFCFALGGGI